MQHKLFLESQIEIPEYEESQHFCYLALSRPNPFKVKVNEDSMGYFYLSEDRLVLAVADGAGGHPKGELASRVAVEALGENLSQLKDKYEDSAVRNAILDAIELGSQRIIEEGSGAKTTLSVCEMRGRWARSYQVGDSGLLIVGQKGKLKFKTTSHSPVGYGVEAGLIEESEALGHPDLNQVANFVGDRGVRIEISSWIELSENDTLLLASDGIFDNFSSASLIESIRTGSLFDVAQDFMTFFDERQTSDPEGLNTKFDDVSFFLLRPR